MEVGDGARSRFNEPRALVAEDVTITGWVSQDPELTNPPTLYLFWRGGNLLVDTSAVMTTARHGHPLARSGRAPGGGSPSARRSAGSPSRAADRTGGPARARRVRSGTRLEGRGSRARG